MLAQQNAIAATVCLACNVPVYISSYTPFHSVPSIQHCMTVTCDYMWKIYCNEEIQNKAYRMMTYQHVAATCILPSDHSGQNRNVENVDGFISQHIEYTTRRIYTNRKEHGWHLTTYEYATVRVGYLMMYKYMYLFNNNGSQSNNWSTKSNKHWIFK